MIESSEDIRLCRVQVLQHCSKKPRLISDLNRKFETQRAQKLLRFDSVLSYAGSRSLAESQGTTRAHQPFLKRHLAKGISPLTFSALRSKAEKSPSCLVSSRQEEEPSWPSTEEAEGLVDRDRVEDSVREALKFIQLTETERNQQFSADKRPSAYVVQSSDANSAENLEENHSLLELFHKDSFKTICTVKQQKSVISSPLQSKYPGRASPSLHSAHRPKKQLQSGQHLLKNRPIL